VITFLNVGAFTTTNNRLVSAEVRLFETSNRIEVHYGPLVAPGGATTDFTASAGWENTFGNRGGNVLGACTASCASLNWPTDTVVTYTP
jgi:hypothetical protein